MAHAPFTRSRSRGRRRSRDRKKNSRRSRDKSSEKGAARGAESGDTPGDAAVDGKKKRKSRWGAQDDLEFIPGMPVTLPPNLTDEQQRLYLS